MKPEAKKKNREIKTINKFQHKWKSGSDSCFDLKKLAEALDLEEGKSNEAAVDTKSFVNKQSENSSSYDFSELSEALSVAEKEEKNLDNVRSMTQKKWLGIRMRQLSLLQCINGMKKKTFLEHGKEPLRALPITIRLNRIIAIHQCRQRMLLH
uniref:Uncharacterized protein n=1 Tax=Rhizophora mucronata TaxID=61149 RepID=A0A2P2IWK6_RHIMU